MNTIEEIIKNHKGSLIKYNNGGVYDQMIEDFRSKKSIPSNWRMKRNLLDFEINLERPDKEVIIETDEGGGKRYLNVVKIFLYIGVDWKDYSICYSFGDLNKTISQIIVQKHEWQLDFSKRNDNIKYLNWKCKKCEIRGISHSEQMRYILPNIFFECK